MYVSMAKRKILECLELPAETLALLTSNDKETNLHAVPLWSVTLKSMARLLKHYRGRYTTVVGFQPTGWTQKQGVLVLLAALLHTRPVVPPYVCAKKDDRLCDKHCLVIYRYTYVHAQAIQCGMSSSI